MASNARSRFAAAENGFQKTLDISQEIHSDDGMLGISSNGRFLGLRPMRDVHGWLRRPSPSFSITQRLIASSFSRPRKLTTCDLRLHSLQKRRAATCSSKQCRSSLPVLAPA